ncbi:MAG: DNRLRE domain-containing protein [Phycisphaerales bacterium]
MKMCAAMLIATVGASSAVAGTMVSLAPSRDTSIYNDGTGDLANGAGPGLFAGRNGVPWTTRALIAFDLASSIPAGSVITSVELRLTKAAGPSSANTFSLFKVTSDWGEGTTVAGGGGGGGGPATPNSATWLHTFHNTSFWTTPGGDFAASASAGVSVTGNGTYAWTSAQMVADAQAWLDSGATNFGWILRGTEEGSGTASRFNSRENTNVAARPQLIVTYVPGPGAGATLAVLGLAALRRRR